MDRRLLVIAWDEWGWRLRRLFDLWWGEGRVQVLCLDRSLFDDEPFTDPEELTMFYEQACCFINQEYSPKSLRGLTVLFALQVELPPGEGADKRQRDVWKPLLRYDTGRERPHPRAILLSWLVLTYPEVRWMFLPEKETKQITLCADNLTEAFHIWRWIYDLEKVDEGNTRLSRVWVHSLHPRNTTPMLFDPTGLRNRIRQQIRSGGEGGAQDMGIPSRTFSAACLDEEEEYAYFNAYVAYRHGYRAWVITTWREAELILKGDAPLHLTMEDLYLNFPDRPERYRDNRSDGQEKEFHLSLLEERDAMLQTLKRASRRALITVGHRRGSNVRPQNHAYQQKHHRKFRMIYKPVAGVYDLWIRVKAPHEQKKNNPFRWPPDKPQRTSHPRHSAPGRLLMIAERLLDRAEQILSEAHETPDYVHAALLALEAKELLASRTPTASLHALSLQHEAEVLAESTFTGVQYNFRVKERFKDIEQDINSIAHWFNKKHRDLSGKNAQLQIIDRLARRFRDAHQFEEELDCLAKARLLRTRIWVAQSSWRWTIAPVLYYFAFALQSVHLFFGLVLVWALVWTLVYWGVKDFNGLEGLRDAFLAANYYTLALEPVNDQWGWSTAGIDSWGWGVILWLQAIVSLFNIGLFVSHLYLLISRR